MKKKGKIYSSPFSSSFLRYFLLSLLRFICVRNLVLTFMGGCYDHKTVINIKLSFNLYYLQPQFPFLLLLSIFLYKELMVITERFQNTTGSLLCTQSESLETIPNTLLVVIVCNCFVFIMSPVSFTYPTFAIPTIIVKTCYFISLIVH